MKKILALVAALGLSASSFGVITEVSQSSDYLELDFSIQNLAVFEGPTTETFEPTAFPGSELSFTFDDRISQDIRIFGFFGPFGPGNLESFATDPSSGFFEANVDVGNVYFNGSYSGPGYNVFWEIDSYVSTTILGDDTWSGTFRARVPDSGSSLTLLGLSLIGLFFARRHKNS